MKTVYAECNEYILNDELLESKFHYMWHYGELPATLTRNFDNFEDFYDVYGFNRKTFFRKRPYVALSEFSAELIFRTATRKNFKSFSEVTRFIPSRCVPTIQELMNRLSADDFIEYCKDNGFNVCPLR